MNPSPTVNLMRNRKTILVIVIALTVALAAAACVGDEGERGSAGAIGPPGQPGKLGPQGDAGPSGPTGPAGLEGVPGTGGDTGSMGEIGPAGPIGAPPPDDELRTVIEILLAELSISGDPVQGDPVLGGLLYDNWPVVSGVTPEDEQALWSQQTTNARTGVATVRCKECHGWDYKGAGGAYSSGSHFTGFTGVMSASRALSQDDLMEVLVGGNDFRHDFSDSLTSAEIESLAAFIKTGLINNATYIDYSTKTPRQEIDIDRGNLLYGRTCSSCHGDDGQGINFGSSESPVYISTLAGSNPWEFVHKTRFGQPGVSRMPASEERGWSIEDVLSVLGYAQTLPAE